VRRCEEPFWRRKVRGRQEGEVMKGTADEWFKIVEEDRGVADFYVDRCLTRLERD
jgi:hypothetical protein